MLGILVALKGRGIHFMHGTHWGDDAPGALIGKYMLHFADGTSVKRPQVLGRDVLELHAEPPPPGDGNATMACRYNAQMVYLMPIQRIFRVTTCVIHIWRPKFSAWILFPLRKLNRPSSSRS
jgi:hypothetical protein